MSAVLFGLEVGIGMGCVPFLNGYYTHQDSLEGLYVFFQSWLMVLYTVLTWKKNIYINNK